MSGPPPRRQQAGTGGQAQSRDGGEPEGEPPSPPRSLPEHQEEEDRSRPEQIRFDPDEGHHQAGQEWTIVPGEQHRTRQHREHEGVERAGREAQPSDPRHEHPQHQGGDPGPAQIARQQGEHEQRHRRPEAGEGDVAGPERKLGKRLKEGGGNGQVGEAVQGGLEPRIELGQLLDRLQLSPVVGAVTTSQEPSRSEEDPVVIRQPVGTGWDEAGQSVGGQTQRAAN